MSAASLCRIAALALAAAALPAALAAQQPLIRGPIDEARRFTLAGNTRPEAIPRNDLGPVEDSFPMDHMQLLLQRPAALQQQLDAYTESLTRKGSPNFHHWLTPQQFGQRFGVAQDDIDQVTAWLQLHGFTVNLVYPNRMMIDFTGTADQVREDFHTEMRAYDVRGVRHVANDRDPQIPAALAPVVAGIVSLHDFRPHTNLVAKPDFTWTRSDGLEYAMAPADLATIYNLKPLFANGYTGKGQTIVVIEDTYVYSTADWVSFRKAFGLGGYTSATFTQMMPAQAGKTGSNCLIPYVNADSGEAIVDAEWASAAAPDAQIVLAACASTNSTFGGLVALQNLINASPKPAPIVSISYGECEANTGATENKAFNAAYQQAATQGVSVFVSAGDWGAATCDSGNKAASHGIAISGWASTPYNVAVGGTDFLDTYLGLNSTFWTANNSATWGSAASYIPEMPWDDSCANSILATYRSGKVPWGPSGYCNTRDGETHLSTFAGSGGPSGCATGTPAITGVVSGTCKGYAKPSWQSAPGVPNDGVRDIPDVSLFAANGLWRHYYPLCNTDTFHGGTATCDTTKPQGWQGVGGTSISSPILAGIQALVNQKWGRQGNPNPVYYQIARSQFAGPSAANCNSILGAASGASCVFHDIQAGDNNLNCTGTRNCYLGSAVNGIVSTSNTAIKPAYQSAPGWDFTTGLGSVNAYNLVMSTAW